MKKLNITALAAGVVLLAGCTTNPYTGEQQARKAGIYGGIGAVSGAVIGAATSSKKDRTKGALIGAAVGGAAGGGYGYYVDTQEAKLRQTLQGTGVQVQRNGDNLTLIMPGNITFASNSADISSSFYPTLNSLVQVFKEFNKNGVDIVGHTDSTGSLQLNQDLSNRRAQSVATGGEGARGAEPPVGVAVAAAIPGALRAVSFYHPCHVRLPESHVSHL